jgi:hypothetical protein
MPPKITTRMSYAYVFVPYWLLHLNFEAFIREASPSMFLLERKDDGREEGAKLSGALLLF